MECINNIQVDKYLNRFDEILNQMSNKMYSYEMTQNITINFINCMIPHHQAAIYMCENLLKYANYEPLINIANNIINMQTKGIKTMRKICDTTPNCCNLKKDIICYIDRYYDVLNNMICKMKNSPKCKNINLDFIDEMIPHHKGALGMCNNLLNFCIDPRLEEEANLILKEQSTGIVELENIRKSICENKL